MEFRQSHIGGGGYITGILQDPGDTNRLYARCDVAGVFRSDDRGESWAAKNAGMTLGFHHNVQSFALHPERSGVLLRGSGDGRSGRTFGAMHKSVDGGESWYQVSDELDFFGNGPTRMFGEVISFSPDASFVLAGAYSHGIWRSIDEGETWNYCGLRGARISFVRPHPSVCGLVYAGAVSDSVLALRAGESIEDAARRCCDTARGTSGQLFCSCDGGVSWSLLHEGGDFTDLCLHPDNRDLMIATTQEMGIVRSEDGGRNWEACGGDWPENRFNAVTTGHSPEPVIYAAPDVRPDNKHSPFMPVYSSDDFGRTWVSMTGSSKPHLRGYPEYMSDRHAGWAISKVLVDHDSANRMYLCNWFGVAISDDGGRSWNANGFRGFETTCVEDVISDRLNPDRVYLLLADHQPNVSVDGGITFRPFTRDGRGYSNSTALATSPHKPDFVVYGLKGERSHPSGRFCSAIYVTDDCGRSCRCVLELPRGVTVQAIVHDHGQPGRFFAYLDGRIERYTEKAVSAGIYQSVDWGKTWFPLPVEWPENLSELPSERKHIECDLLPVVVTQQKNVCGTNKLLHLSTSNELYIGEWTEGIFRLSLSDCTLQRADAGLPFKRTKDSVLVVITGDPTRTSVLYAGFVREGMWRSRDGGTSWTKVYPHDGSALNVSAIEVDPGSSSIVFCSEPLYQSPCESIVMRSLDDGATWESIPVRKFGAPRFKGLAVSARTVVAGSCGNGVYFGVTD